MRLLVVYRPESEFSRVVENFVHDFQRWHEGPGRRLEIQSTESREGAATMSLYDIYEHPAIIILGDNGSLVKHWTGGTMPLMDEVAGYFTTAQS